jgi:hypothetical protein
MISSSQASPLKPTTRSTSPRRPLKKTTVGVPCTERRAAVRGAAAAFTSATSTRPW